MSGTPNPVRQITGLTDTSNVSKADLISWALSHVPQVLADAADINARDLAGQLIIYNLSNGRAYALDSGDTTTVDDGSTCIRDFNGLAFKPVAIVGMDLTGGITAENLGTITTGTITPLRANGEIKRLVNGGVFTWAATSEVGGYLAYVTNNGSAGAITASGFDDEQTANFDTTDTHRFEVAVTNDGSKKIMTVRALQ